MSKRTAFIVAGLLTVMVAGCTAPTSFGDGPSKVTIKHRVPSK